MARLRKTKLGLQLVAVSEHERALIAFALENEAVLHLRGAVYPVESDALVLPPTASDLLIAQIDEAFGQAARAHQEATERRSGFRVV